MPCPVRVRKVVGQFALVVCVGRDDGLLLLLVVIVVVIDNTILGYIVHNGFLNAVA